jgi:hypothetical protein
MMTKKHMPCIDTKWHIAKNKLQTKRSTVEGKRVDIFHPLFTMFVANKNTAQAMIKHSRKLILARMIGGSIQKFEKSQNR